MKEPPMGIPALHIANLAVSRGGRRIVDGLSLSVLTGEIYALLGGNGSGKSTTLFAVLGLLPRTGGVIRVAGHDPARDGDAVRRSAAYLPENVALYDHLSAIENVRYFLSLAGVSRSEEDIHQALSAVRLDASAWDRRVGAFSKGMRQKTAIALALLRRAPVLLLDEPTSGLDPASARDFQDLLVELKNRGVATLMVTHDLLGAADVADRIGILDAGRLVREWRAAAALDRFDVQELHRSFTGAAAAA